MQKSDFGKIVIREIVIISSCFTMAFGAGRLGRFIPGIGKEFFSLKLAAMLYVASIAFRVAGLFIRMTLAVAFTLGFIAVIILLLAARYPAAFAFLK
jgi:hypothetical protein